MKSASYLRRNAVIVGLLALALALLGWRTVIMGRPSSREGGAALTVAAAANLQFAFVEIGQLFEAETGQAVLFSFGSSGNLARQIEHGAPVDVFAAANAAYVDELHTQGLIVAASRQVYAQGRVALAVNRASGVQVARLQDLLGADVTYVALANPAHAPYGLAVGQAMAVSLKKSAIHVLDKCVIVSNP